LLKMNLPLLAKENQHLQQMVETSDK